MSEIIRYHGVLPPLISLWRRSVGASHDFLAPEDVEFYAGVLNNALPHLEIWAALDAGGKIQGFMALDKWQVNMLFVEPACFGQGVGQGLLRQALCLRKKLEVYVNEQNSKAYAFYRKFGFKPIARLPLDGSGRPFPLVQMAYQPDALP